VAVLRSVCADCVAKAFGTTAATEPAQTDSSTPRSCDDLALDTGTENVRHVVSEDLSEEGPAAERRMERLDGVGPRSVRDARYNRTMIDQPPSIPAPDFVEDERSSELEQLHTAADLLLSTAGTVRWSPRDLQARARNGNRRDVVSLAFWQLVSDGRLLLDSDLRVRRAARR